MKDHPSAQERAEKILKSKKALEAFSDGDFMAFRDLLAAAILDAQMAMIDNEAEREKNNPEYAKIIAESATRVMAGDHMAEIIRIGKEVFAAVDMDGCTVAHATCAENAEVITRLMNWWRSLPKKQRLAALEEMKKTHERR